MSEPKRQGRDVWLDVVMSQPHDSPIGKFKALGYWIAKSIFETYGRVLAFHSAGTLGSRAGMSRATSFRAMDTFYEEGFIGRKAGGGRGKVTTYWLELPSQCCDSLEAETVSAWERYCLNLRKKLSQDDPETVSLLRLHIRLLEDSSKRDLKIPTAVAKEGEDEPFTAFLHPGQCRNIIGIHVARMLGRVTEGTSDADRFAVGARTASEIPELDHLISRMREGDLRPSDLIAIADRMRRAA